MTGPPRKFYVDGTLVASRSFTGNVGDSNDVAHRRLRREAGRLLRRPDRRGSDLRRRAQRGRGDDRHEHPRAQRHDRADRAWQLRQDGRRRVTRSPRAGSPSTDDCRRRRLPPVPRRARWSRRPRALTYTFTGLTCGTSYTLGRRGLRRRRQRVRPHAADRVHRGACDTTAPDGRRSPLRPPARRSRHGRGQRDRERQRLGRGRAVQARRREPRQRGHERAVLVVVGRDVRSPRRPHADRRRARSPPATRDLGAVDVTVQPRRPPAAGRSPRTRSTTARALSPVTPPATASRARSSPAPGRPASSAARSTSTAPPRASTCRPSAASTSPASRSRPGSRRPATR